MGGRPLFEPDESEALAPFFVEAPSRIGGARELRFEYSSRGDRVPGRLLLPAAGDGPHPLVLLQHGAGGSKDVAYLDAVCGPWVQRGAAVSCIDAPLHGDRSSPKFTPRMLMLLAGATPPAAFDAELWIDFVRQAVIDLRRELDVLAGLPEIDSGRTAYAAFSLGSILGTPFCAEDTRIRAAALAIGGGGFGPVSVDPIGHVGRIAPRPVLFVGASQDERIPREHAEALHEAAKDPKQVLWFDCAHSELPGRALKAMWSFLEPHLASR